MIRSENDHECTIRDCSISPLCKVLWTWTLNKVKGNGDTFPFSLFSAFSTVEIRKVIVLCLEVKMTMNALYANVLKHFVSKKT